MIVGRILGWILIVAAVVALVVEIFGSIVAGSYQFLVLAQVWAWISTNSLVGFQALVEKSIDPWLWSSVILPVLITPAWIVLGIVGGLLAFLFRRRRRRRRRQG